MSSSQPAMGNLRELLRPYYLRWLYFPFFSDAEPHYFADCWRFPSCELNSPTLPDAMSYFGTPAPEPDLLFLPMTDWHARLQRTQHLARAFAARGHRCLVVNPHLGREFPTLYVREPGHRISLLESRIAELHIRLPREPVYHHRVLSPSENQVLVEAFERVVSLLGARRVIQILSFPIWLPAAEALRAQFKFPVVYDCHDMLSGFKGIAPEIVRQDNDLLQSCDLAIFSAEYLRAAKTAEFPELGTKSLLVRNAVDLAHFRKHARKQSGRKVVGYAGSLNYWFDTAAVEQAAKRQPHWTFVLIGRVEHAPILALRELPNVEFVGEVPYTDLPRHMARFDVGLIPFFRNTLTLSTNAIKLYEYFALGLPVVGSRLPELELLGDLVYLSDNPGEFAAFVEAAGSENDLSRVKRRIEVAARESWSARVTQMLAAFAGLPLPQKA